jgi:hypothetical protein
MCGNIASVLWFHVGQISWGAYMVDALFHQGSDHSNHGYDFMKAIRVHNERMESGVKQGANKRPGEDSHE